MRMDDHRAPHRMGFGLFIFFALVVVLLPTPLNSRPSMRRLTMCTVHPWMRWSACGTGSDARPVKHWALVESIPDAPETALVARDDLPALTDRIDTLRVRGTRTRWHRARPSTMKELFTLHDSVADYHLRI